MSEMLSLWNETTARKAILDYVNAVTNPESADFVPEAERIAIMDNDGTMWVEKPTYVQIFFAIDRLKQLAESDPKLLNQPSFKAAATGDLAYFSRLDPHIGGNVKELMKIVFDSHAGMSQDNFMLIAKEFLETARHPRFGVLYRDLTYKPMVEFVHYLGDNGFKVFLASGGGMSFMRTVSEEIYNIPRERVIGSNIAFETRLTDEGPVVFRRPGLVDPIDDGPGKPVNIELHIGRKPILTAGNSDGDLHMLWLAQKSGHCSLSLLLRHDDAEREYTYDEGSEKTLQMAEERGWIVISMKDDWKTVF
ncbi:haloacid dehalogenase-like hydrolase [Methanosarcina barkeri str. Wiesmoor]|uniref:Haloacid dehalogenase-like hydrolase n=2 Tax=Methanosarcina barkeri TaxID=2208 RepID=A0A0E3QJ78_METBA|nr:haloacid dehalogenase-like hydrolase [Methanosarcina barkeri]AKB50902.1 haloacid dehalogenase-like hydrolase [Methanosarcina barkeri str. Wiesmoor]